jgi:hypothetical protein
VHRAYYARSSRLVVCCFSRQRESAANRQQPADTADYASPANTVILAAAAAAAVLRPCMHLVLQLRQQSTCQPYHVVPRVHSTAHCRMPTGPHMLQLLLQCLQLLNAPILSYSCLVTLQLCLQLLGGRTSSCCSQHEPAALALRN